MRAYTHDGVADLVGALLPLAFGTLGFLMGTSGIILVFLALQKFMLVLCLLWLSFFRQRLSLARDFDPSPSLFAMPANSEKEHLSIVICGHVDSGKSTTTGRLIFELGGLPERELEKLKAEAERLGKGSFAFAFYMDRQRPLE